MQTSQPQNTENLDTDVKKSGDFSKNLEIDRLSESVCILLIITENWTERWLDLLKFNYGFPQNLVQDSPKQAKNEIIQEIASFQLVPVFREISLSRRETVRLNWKPRVSRQNRETWEVLFALNCFSHIYKALCFDCCVTSWARKRQETLICELG